MNSEPTELPRLRKRSRFPTFQATLLGLTLVCGIAGARATTPADADAIFEAHTKAFYQEKDGRAWHAKSTDGDKADFWTRAEQMEMVLDVHARTRDAKPLAMFAALFRGFLADNGRTWARNPFNDDIMWMVIACARAHLATGNPEYLTAAKENFDLCYKRAISPDLGGGLWWKTDNKSKNACVNGPGAIAASLLARATRDDSYTTKAKEIFLWERATLFDAQSGRVFDNIGLDKRVNRMALSYNQGTFVGAAHLLGFDAEARLAATFAMNNLGRNGYLPGSGEKGDGGGFNGICVRWIALFMNNHHEQATFEPWLRKNADAAWQARRESDNLSWCNAPQPTPAGTRYSWGCSNAVVLLQVVQPSATAPSKPVR